MIKKFQIVVLLAVAVCARSSFGAEKKAADAALPSKSSPAQAVSNSNTDKNVSADDEAAKKKKKEELSDSEGYVFGYRNGYVHLALDVNEEWTDNLYNSRIDKQENFLTHVAPSVWFTWPRRARRPLQIAPDNTPTGGMQYSLSEYDVFNKYQVYLAGKLDFMKYSANSDLDHTESGFEGLIQYQPGARLTLHLLDKYSLSQDIFNITEATAANDRAYNSNIFGLGGEWEFFDKFSARLDYKNFLLQYQDEINSFMDRTDNGFEGAFSYKYSPKTKFFLDYQQLFAGYDEKKMPDNSNRYFHAGLNWQATVKTSLMFKAGYQQVTYDYAATEYGKPATLSGDSQSGMDVEAQGIWQATRKSNLLLNAKYNIEQTDSEQALNKAVFAGRLGFDYRFTNRLRGDINLIYEHSDYTQFIGDDRLDDRWYLKPGVQYALTKWLSVTVYCSFDTKNSNFDALDYDTRTIGIGLRGTL